MNDCGIPEHLLSSWLKVAEQASIGSEHNGALTLQVF
jgi:hypothetical protein